MAITPPDTTGRLYVDYHANGRDHTMQFRTPGTGTPDSTILETIDQVLLDWAHFMPNDWAFISSAYAAPGSNIRLPIGFTPTTFAGAQDVVISAAPAYMTIVGRSTTGKRWRSRMLGVSFTPFLLVGETHDYRVTTGEDSNVSTLVLAYAEAEIVAVDGSSIFVYDYANLGFDAHWQKKVRTS